MEGLQGLFNACLFGKDDEGLELELESREKERDNDDDDELGLIGCGNFVNPPKEFSFGIEEEKYRKAPNLVPPPQSSQYWNSPILDVENQSIPFLQMLQTVQSPQPFSPFSQEPSPDGSCFQVLLKLQNQKWPLFHQQTHIQMDYPHDPSTEIHSPAKSEYPHSAEPPTTTATASEEETLMGSSCSRRRKRKRSKPAKNKEEVENQRMTHINVERNRRRQMNDHLSSLRSLMPSSYVQRGDQASIIGGAINFVKELEQLLQSLEGESHKRKRREDEDVGERGLRSINGGREQGRNAEEEEEDIEIEMKVIQNHVNLKIECERKSRSKRPNQELVRAIVALESLRLTVLHLNITSMDTSVHYSFSLKIEEDCKVGSAEEIARTVRGIFSFLSSPTLHHHPPPT